jgi:peroxiredoxin
MLNLGDQAPDFSLLGIDQSSHSLGSLKGEKATAVIFSCNHCPYVKAYEERMISAANDFQGQGVNFVVINANDPVKYPDDNLENMIVRAEEKGYPFPYLQDETQEIAKSFGAERTPEVFLFDGELKLQYHGAIDDNYEDPSSVSVTYLKNAMTAIVAGQVVEVKESQPVGCTIKWK